MNNSKRQHNGFTLIELSIVIVIIGFLVAGIAVGTNMIKQAQLRSVITDLQQYQTAYNNFVGRYNQIPGDMSTASSFWPATTGTASCSSTAVNCNGNGDGLINWSSTAVGSGVGDEQYKAWKHLSLAGMISAGIAQIPTGYSGVVTIGDKAPLSKINGAGYVMGGNTIGNAMTSPWNNGITNAVFIGKPAASNSLMNGALTAEEAFNIDQKIDDGIVSSGVFMGAATGNIRVKNSADAPASPNGCLNASGNYNVSIVGTYCLLGAALN